MDITEEKNIGQHAIDMLHLRMNLSYKTINDAIKNIESELQNIQSVNSQMRVLPQMYSDGINYEIKTKAILANLFNIHSKYVIVRDNNG